MGAHPGCGVDGVKVVLLSVHRRLCSVNVMASVAVVVVCQERS